MQSILDSAAPTPKAPAPKAPAPKAQPESTGAASSASMLKQIEAKAERSVPPKYQNGFHRIVAAGKKAMFSEQTFPEMQKYMNAIQGPESVPQYVAHGVIKLLTLIFNQSKGTMPLEPVGLAATMFMCDALEYLEQVKKMPIDKAVIDQTTFAVKDGVLAWLKKASGISEEEWQKVMAGKGGQAAQSQPNAPAAQAPPAQGPMGAVPQGGA